MEIILIKTHDIAKNQDMCPGSLTIYCQYVTRVVILQCDGEGSITLISYRNLF